MPDIVVDTSEMADSLDHVSSKVSETTLAVVAMQQEVCEIEKQISNVFYFIRVQLRERTLNTIYQT